MANMAKLRQELKYHETVYLIVKSDGNEIAMAKAKANWNEVLHKIVKQERKNANKRAENQILRDLCGTSARAAREDMGL